MNTRKRFNKAYIKEIMSKRNFFKITGIRYEEGFSLTGATAIRPFHEIVNPTMNGKYPSPRLVVTDKDFDIETWIGFFSNEIRAELIIAPNLGYKIMKAKIENAIKYEFDKITCEAARGYHYDGTPYIGYKLWHRYGFQMDEDSQLEFDNFIDYLRKKKRIGAQEKIETLNDFTKDPWRKKLWDKIGCTWSGFFDLKKNSKSRIIFDAYVAEQEKLRMQRREI